jgi:hypothetical protein
MEPLEYAIKEACNFTHKLFEKYNLTIIITTKKIQLATYFQLKY